MADIEVDIVVDDATNVTVASPPSVDLTTFEQPFTVVVIPEQGRTGPTGPPGNATPVHNENPTGTRDGSNTVFGTLFDYVPLSTSVYVNGLREFLGDGYTESGPAQITLSDPPGSTDNIRIDYLVQ